MDRRQFRAMMTKEFYPILRAEGFTGSGSTLRRVDGEFLHVVNLQGSAGLGTYVNLGAHLPCLSPEIPTSPTTVTESACVFRERLVVDGTDRIPFDASAEEVLTARHEQGPAWFARYPGTSAGQRSALAELLSRSHPASQLMAAGLQVHLGAPDDAVATARAALPRVPEPATTLRDNLLALVAEHG